MSRIYKSYQSKKQIEEKKLITLKPIPEKTDNEEFEPTNFNKDKLNKIVTKAEKQAEQIIARAKQQAKEISEQINIEKENWEQEKAQLIAAAKDEGFTVGHAEGKQQGYDEVSGAIQEAQGVIDTAKIHYNDKVFAAERTILKLGLKVAEKVVNQSLNIDERLLSTIVEGVLKEVREDREVQIHIHPNYYDLLVAQKDELLNIFPGETSLYLYPDEDLPETGCIIESESGRIDASVDSQLAEIKQKLFELLESET